MGKASRLRVLVSIALAFIILVGLVPVHGDDAPSRVVFINYTFENLPVNQTPSGWTYNLGSAGYFVVTNETSYDGQESVKFNDTSSTAVFSAYSYFPEQKDTIVVSFYVKMPNNTGPGTGLEISVDNGNFEGANIIFNDTAIQYFDGSKGLVTLRNSYQTGRWYRVEFVMDIPRKVYNIHVDGHLEVSDARFNGTASSIQRIALAESDLYYLNQTGKLMPAAYIDDVLGVQGLKVPDDFPTIQAAVNYASNSDTIVLNASRVYFENVVVPANKNGITIEGQDEASTIIDGEFNITSPFCISLNGCANVTIFDLTVRDSYNGSAQIRITGDNNTVSFCNVTAGLDSGIRVDGSNSIITDNLIQDNLIGVDINSGTGNVVQNNTILNNTKIGVRVQPSASQSLIYGNRFVKNTHQALDLGTGNKWDDGYPTGGNYWSDFINCTDIYSGPAQDVGPNSTMPSPDGICDQPYQTGKNGIDNYPLYLVQSVSQTPALTHGNCELGVFDKSVQYSDTVTVTVKTLPKVQINDSALIVNYTFANGTTGSLKIPPIIQGNVITFTIPTFVYNTTVRYFAQVLADGSSWLNTTNYPIPFPYLVDDTTPPTFGSGGVGDSPDEAQFIIVWAVWTEPVNASGISKVWVSYLLNSTVWTGQMTYIGNNNYTGVIPKQAGGSTLNYNFSAVDNAGNLNNNISSQTQYVRKLDQLLVQYNNTIPLDPCQIYKGDFAVGQTITDGFNITNNVNATDDSLAYSITTVTAGPWFTLKSAPSGVLSGGQFVTVSFTIVTPSDPGLHAVELSVQSNGTIPQWAVVINFTVANIIIDGCWASSQWPSRVNAGQFQLVAFHAEWALNCSDAAGGSITISNVSTSIATGGKITIGNGGTATTNATGWAVFQVNSTSPAKTDFNVTAVKFAYVNSYVQRISGPTVAWDRVMVILTMGNGNYTNVDSNAIISTNKSYYELDRILGYNNVTFTGAAVFNDSLFRDHATSSGITTSQIGDPVYGLTAFESTSISVIWDEIKIIAAGVSSPQVSINQSASVWYIGIYEFDNTLFRGENGSMILSDGSKNYVMSWSSDDREMWQQDLSYSTAGTRNFTIVSVEDNVHGLTKIRDGLDPMTITWGPQAPLPWWKAWTFWNQNDPPANTQDQPNQSITQTQPGGGFFIMAIIIILILGLGSVLTLMVLMKSEKRSKSNDFKKKRRKGITIRI